MRANTCRQAHAAAQAETVLSQRLHHKCFSTSDFLRSTSHVVETLHVARFELRLHVVVSHLWFQISVRDATRRSPLPEVDKRKHLQIPATRTPENQLARLVETCENSHQHGEIVRLAIVQGMTSLSVSGCRICIPKVFLRHDACLNKTVWICLEQTSRNVECFKTSKPINHHLFVQKMTQPHSFDSAANLKNMT